MAFEEFYAAEFGERVVLFAEEAAFREVFKAAGFDVRGGPEFDVGFSTHLLLPGSGKVFFFSLLVLNWMKASSGNVTGGVGMV